MRLPFPFCPPFQQKYGRNIFIHTLQKDGFSVASTGYGYLLGNLADIRGS